MLLFYLNMVDTPEEESKVEALYLQYRRLMKYIAYDILLDEQLAEDAVHDAFIKIFRHLEKISDVSGHKTRSFVVIVIRSVALDILKREKRQAETIEDIGEAAADGDVLDALEVRDLLEQIEALPAIHRDVLLLRAYHDYSDKQIAEILGITPAAARKRIERARAALAQLLDEKGGEG